MMSYELHENNLKNTIPTDFWAYVRQLVITGKSGILAGPKGIGKSKMLDHIINMDERPDRTAKVAIMDDTCMVGDMDWQGYRDRIYVRVVRSEHEPKFTAPFIYCLEARPDIIMINKMSCSNNEDVIMRELNMHPMKNPRVSLPERKGHLQEAVTDIKNSFSKCEDARNGISVNEVPPEKIQVVVTMDSPGMGDVIETLATSGTLDCWDWIASFGMDDSEAVCLESAYEIVETGGSPRIIKVCEQGCDADVESIARRSHHLTRDDRFTNLEELCENMIRPKHCENFGNGRYRMVSDVESENREDTSKLNAWVRGDKRRGRWGIFR